MILKDNAMQDTILELLEYGTDIPSPPTIALRILEEIKNDECSLESLSRIIEIDPALVTKILRIANSSYFGQISEVTTLPRAFSVLGLNAVKNIVLSFVLADQFRGGEENAFNYDLFWRRSITTAVSAELVCELIGTPCEDIFITSLLQDIGTVFMYICRKDDYLKVLDETRFNLSCAEALETDIFGFNHQELGAFVLKDWGLPRKIYEPIGFHHTPQKAPSDCRMKSEIMKMAEDLSSIYHGQYSADAIGKIKDILTTHYMVNVAQVDALIDTVANRTVDMLSFFEIPPGDMKPFSQILQDANAELGKLNLTYEQLVLQYKTAKETAENLASELQKANRKLHKLATTDGLTGLLNHRAFQEILEKRISESNRHQRWLSLMLLDIDNFKLVNDRYGHPVGDAVLKIISRTIPDILRKEDILARYGGEEYSIILPETDTKGAVTLAERIRRCVEDLVIKIDNLSFSITISIGIGTKNFNRCDCNNSELITIADKALYAAKHAGRNNVRASILKVA